MVHLRKDKKGMIAIVDAMIFITLLSLVAIGLFSYGALNEHEDPLAKTVTEQLFETEVRMDDLCQTEDTQIEPLYVIAAANLNTEYTSKTEKFVKDTLNLMIPEYCGYELILEYNGHSMDIHRESDREMSSEYSTEYFIDGAGTVHVSLIIY